MIVTLIIKLTPSSPSIQLKNIFLEENTVYKG